MNGELARVLPFRLAKSETSVPDSTEKTAGQDPAPLFVPAFDKEPCTMPGCKNETGYTRQTPADLRACYVEGSGQLCRECYGRIYPRPGYGGY